MTALRWLSDISITSWTAYTACCLLACLHALLLAEAGIALKAGRETLPTCTKLEA